MNVALHFPEPLANAIGMIVSTDSLIVLSNFLIVIVTMVAVVVSVIETHRTIRDVTKSDDRLIAKLLGWAIEPVNGKHKEERHVK